ncbi:MAG: hypothetical protein H6Q59_2015 [Firmicutes bacterium]|nr:hypothetical protein [Bacillota bacterium]
MSDMSTTSCTRNNNCDNGLSPIFLILMLTMCGGSGGLFGGGCGGGQGGCGFGGCDNGLDGILPLILILSLCGGGL